MRYITDIRELESILLEKHDEPKYALKKVKTLVLMGELFMNSIKMLDKYDINVKYVDTREFGFKSSDKAIQLYDNGKHVLTLDNNDTKETLILMRSGYCKPQVHEALQIMCDMGFVVLNHPDAVELTSDKYKTAVFLDKIGVKQPKYALVTSADIDKEDHKKLDEKLLSIYKEKIDTEKGEGNLFVCKILNGHGGKGVFICRGKNIVSILQCLWAINEKTPILVQEALNIKDGDIRVHVININGKQKIIDSCMRVKGDRDFRTNLSLGCDCKPIELTKEQEKLALESAAASGLVWCGVDILPTVEGENYVVELNGAPGPTSQITDPDIEKTNCEFFHKLIEGIESLC